MGDGLDRPGVGGGVEGNERLTALTGLLLIVLLAVLGVTIVRIGQLLWLHLFLGLVLLGPIALKLVSTGYRFVRYYTWSREYRRRGPPPMSLRALAPLVVLSTVGVFVTGVVLLLAPGSRSPMLLLHKVCFFFWLACTGLHVLGHLPELAGLWPGARRTRREVLALRATAAQAQPIGGARARTTALIVAMVVGAALAVALLGQFSAWTH